MDGKRSAANPYDRDKVRLTLATKHIKPINLDLILI